MPHPLKPIPAAVPQRLNGFGFASLTLGLCGLVLFFWQPLALVISFCGLLLGIFGVVRASLRHQGAGLRYSAGGTLLCLAATFLSLAVWFGGRVNFQRPF